MSPQCDDKSTNFFITFLFLVRKYCAQGFFLQRYF